MRPRWSCWSAPEWFNLSFSGRFLSNYQTYSNEPIWPKYSSASSTPETDSVARTMNEIAFHTSPVINSKRPFIPQRKSREYQRPLLLLPPKRVPLSSHSFFPSSFLSLLLSGYSSFSPEWVFLSSLFSHPSLRLFLPVPTLSFTRIHLTERKREREREERTSGAAQNTPLPTCRFQIGFLRVPYVRLRGHDGTCRGGRICNLRL